MSHSSSVDVNLKGVSLNIPKSSERGIAVLVTAIILVIVIPMIGLAIDSTILYITKTRLQGAVDGAALAAARALARGSDDAAQQNNARAVAATYVMLNYPRQYFFTTSVTVDQATDVTIDETVAQQRTISVTGHVVVPTLFMRFLNLTSTNVNAMATTVRRDINIALVVDRSGSLAASGSCAPLKQSAINFVNRFANGRDYVSLVTFASSTHVDFAIASNFQTASPSVPALIGNITCAGSTSSAMALWYGYDQLVGLNEPAALNVILFFTDGKPTGVNVNMPLANSSPCTNANSGTPQWINGLYNTFTNANQFFGILQPTNSGTITNGDFNPTTDGNTGAGCNYMSGWAYDGGAHNLTNTSDFAGLPTTDIFGDNLNSGYQSVTLSGGYIALSDSNNAAAAPMNATDDAATQIRNGAALPSGAGLPHTGSLSNVIIYSIGLGNAPYPISSDLLERVSNDPRSTIYDSTKPAGFFVAAPTSADIDAAFAAVASEVLRLAR